MGEPADLPPIEIVSVTDISYAGVARLRIRVAICPEDLNAMTKAALTVIDGHAGDSDIVWIFFPFSMQTGRDDSRRCSIVRLKLTMHEAVEQRQV